MNASFRNVPVAIDIDPDTSDWLWVKNSRFENISKAAVIVSNENSVYTQIGFEDDVVANTPVFAGFRDSGKTLGSNGAYEIKAFNHGLILKAPGEMGEIGTRWDATPLSTLPTRSGSWRYTRGRLSVAPRRRLDHGAGGGIFRHCGQRGDIARAEIFGERSLDGLADFFISQRIHALTMADAGGRMKDKMEGQKETRVS